MEYSFENIILIISFGIPLCLFVLFRKLLNNKKTYSYILILCSIIAAIGIILTAFEIGEDGSLLMLLIPFLSLISYRLMYFYFVKKFNREPLDTSFNWASGLFWDRVFNIAFFPIGVFIPIILVFIIKRHLI
jgi:hypothetical protein|tara:strand:+ start:16 stop:411 length:396 start_codon:yes stop_codon:yes gene_type:complete